MRKGVMGVCLLGLCSVSGGAVERLGVTFAIVEPDLLQRVQAEAAVAWQDATAHISTAVQAYLDRPPPVTGLSRTVTARSWTEDPSMVLAHDIYAPDGTLLIRAGVRYNPLKRVQVENALLFYDADDPDQVRWAHHSALSGGSAHTAPDLHILVKGRVASREPAVADRATQPVYFDQGGRLITRFHIQHVPARVSQAGLVLRVEECIP